MAVLIEGISVVIKVSSITQLTKDKNLDFDSLIPNQTECSDNELSRVGFMAMNDAHSFINILEKQGFNYLEDIIIIDHVDGLYQACEWVELHQYGNESDNTKVIGCRLKDSNEERLFIPTGWEYEGSLYTTGSQFSGEEVKEKLTLLEQKGGMSKYKNNDTGEIVYVGRTEIEKEI